MGHPASASAVDLRCIEPPTLGIEVKWLSVREFHEAECPPTPVLNLLVFGGTGAEMERALDVPDGWASRPAPDCVACSGTLSLCSWRWKSEGSRPRAEPHTSSIRTFEQKPCLGFPATRRQRYRLFYASHSRPALGDRTHWRLGGRLRRRSERDRSGLEEFLNGNSKEAINLRTKLRRCSDDERHAFICMTDAIEQAWLFDDWGCDRVPTRHLQLPERIDCVWVTRGGLTVWRFDESGWECAQMRS